MEFITHLFMWVGRHFTTETYMVLTKAQGMVWSMADIALVYAFLKISDFIRSLVGQKNIRYRYYLLYFTAVLTPLILATENPRQLYLLEALVCGIQFAVLVLTLVIERKGLKGLMKKFKVMGS